MTELHFTGKGSQDDEACVLNNDGRVVARFYGPDAESHAGWEVRRRDGTLGRLMLAGGWLIAAAGFLFLCGSHYARNESVAIPMGFTAMLIAGAVAFFGHHCYLAGRRRELSAQSLQLRLPSPMPEPQIDSAAS